MALVYFACCAKFAKQAAYVCKIVTYIFKISLYDIGRYLIIKYVVETCNVSVQFFPASKFYFIFIKRFIAIIFTRKIFG